MNLYTLQQRHVWRLWLQRGAFFGFVFDPRLVQGVAHGVFTAFANDLWDLQARSRFLQIQPLDLFDLGTCAARFLAHLPPSFVLRLSCGAQAPSTFSVMEWQPIGMIPLNPLRIVPC